MRKRILSATLVAIITLAAGWNVYQNQTGITLNDLALSNVEALARSEVSAKGCCPHGGVCVLTIDGKSTTYEGMCPCSAR